MWFCYFLSALSVHLSSHTFSPPASAVRHYSIVERFNFFYLKLLNIYHQSTTFVTFPCSRWQPNIARPTHTVAFSLRVCLVTRKLPGQFCRCAFHLIESLLYKRRSDNSNFMTRDYGTVQNFHHNNGNIKPFCNTQPLGLMAKFLTVFLEWVYSVSSYFCFFTH